MMRRMIHRFGVGLVTGAGALVAFSAAPAADFGAPFPEVPTSTALAAAIDRGTVGASDAPEVISGRIVEVCQNKGCWVMLEDNGRMARVMMHEHAFSVPFDARGAALVHGTLSKTTLSEAAAAHLAEDAGRSEPVQREEWRIDALSVRIAEDAPVTP